MARYFIVNKEVGMFNTIKKMMFFVPLFFSGNIFSQQEFTASDILGIFADVGTIGSKATTLTVSDAHLECLSEASGGEKVAVDYDTDYYKLYKDCMSEYVPFKIAGAGEAGACSSVSVSWGQCGANIPSLSEGSVFSTKNTLNTDAFEGYASYSCTGGSLAFQGGGCSATAQPCEADQVIDWPVTTPLWADESSATLATDFYGQLRDAPKSRCIARMGEAMSGQLVPTWPTTPEMESPESYNMNIFSINRCFNGKWLDDSTIMNATCQYLPNNCEAKTYAHPDGCVFDLPDGMHNQRVNVSNPQPKNSIGSTEAYCWDGDWEVKSTSCASSCSSSVPSVSWASIPASDRNCGHPTFNNGQRIGPGVRVNRLNETSGLTGSATYVCDNGVLKSNREDWLCSIDKCGQSVGEYSWAGSDGSQCGHNQIDYGVEMTHNETFNKTSNNPLYENIGQAYYLCDFGQLKLTGSSCTGVTEPTCDAFGVTDAEWELCAAIGSVDDDQCCYRETRGTVCLKR